MPRNIYSHALGVERRDGTRQFAVSRVVDAPAERVWDVLTDTTRWDEWGPSVAAVDCPTRYVHEGVTGRVRISRTGLWVPFEIDSYVDGGETKRWTWRVARVPATGHRVDALGEQCRVTFEVPLVAAGYVPVCRRALDRLARLVESRGPDV
ncbi:SRPBCC family protein [Salinigranum halophilum]|uniref:SRPBCC family protein n=1 Tax=Salinigranum halophilum TaxID=2565931 RepID=UPI00115EC932|nr:SRPBCC family protein [Salinigranum halophilum]